MHSTSTHDACGRQVSISKRRFGATAFAGLFPITDMLRTSGVLQPAFDALIRTTSLKKRSHYLPQTMFWQRLMGLVAGCEDLDDHNLLDQDRGFAAALGIRECASASTLCRFENSIDRHCIDAMNQALLKSLVKANRQYHFIPEPTNDRKRCLWLDVDSTHVDLYGNQECKSYNAHYQSSCLAPVLCFLNQWPVALFNAPGTTDARSVLAPQLGRLLANLKQAFPGYTIILRADSGFSSNAIIEQCAAHGVHFLMGMGINCKSQRLAREGLVNAVRKTVKRYTAEGFTRRTLGELITYQAKGWKEPRRIIARKQFDPRTNQLDLRLIQTSIRRCPKGEKGYCPQYSRMSIVDLYEVAYCQRGRCEQCIEEFKSGCFGGRASATRFLTNSYRMLLAMFCQFVLKLSRFVLLRDEKTVMTVRRMRKELLWVTAQMRISARAIVLTLPDFMLNPAAFFSLYKVPIA